MTKSACGVSKPRALGQFCAIHRTFPCALCSALYVLHVLCHRLSSYTQMSSVAEPSIGFLRGSLEAEIQLEGRNEKGRDACKQSVVEVSSPPLLTVEYPKVPGFENSDPQHHYSSCHSASKLPIRDPIDGSARLDIWV